MHYQTAPCEEAKLIRCTAGSVYDAIIDLRPKSSTFTQYISVILTVQNHKILYVPEGFAHGFLTLEDNTEVFYQMSEFYSEGHAKGVRWNDPAFAIEWPLAPTAMSNRDRSCPDFTL